MPVEHTWDDDDPYSVIGDTDDGLIASLAKVSDRAKKGFAIACAEMVLGRLGHLVDRADLAEEYLDASWAGLTEWTITRMWEPDPAMMTGPTAGPLWLAVLTVTNCHTALGLGGGEADGAFAAAIFRHVMPEPGPFEAWCSAIAERLVRIFPRSAADPTGVPVPHQAFDPSPYPERDQFTAESGVAMAKAFAAAVQARPNRFVVPAAERE